MLFVNPGSGQWLPLIRMDIISKLHRDVRDITLLVMLDGKNGSGKV
jgi:hypothetical protein